VCQEAELLLMLIEYLVVNHGHSTPLFRRARRMLLPCAAMNGGGRALPIIEATSDLLSVTGNLYRRGSYPWPEARVASLLGPPNPGTRTRLKLRMLP
jgi:hypothetical protein